MRCGQEMCPNWPGEGCLSGVADCPDPDESGGSGAFWDDLADSMNDPVFAGAYVQASLDIAIADGRWPAPDEK